MDDVHVAALIEEFRGEFKGRCITVLRPRPLRPPRRYQYVTRMLAVRAGIVLAAVLFDTAGCGPGDSIGTFVASCANTTDGTCTDYGDGYQLTLVNGFCSAVASTPCPTTNRIGHCVVVNSTVSPSELSQTNYYSNTAIGITPQMDCSNRATVGSASFFDN